MITYMALGRPAYNKVWYHGNCPDGFCSAMLAWRQLKTGGHHVDYVPVSYGEPMPPTSPSDKVLILDFSYSKAELADLLARVQRVTVLDHHKSAAADIRSFGREDFVYDPDHSGAVMTWSFFHPDTPIPQLVRYIQDRDLWQWNMKGSREVSAALNTLPPSFETWNQLFFAKNRTDINVLTQKGRNILENLDLMTSRIAERARVWNFNGQHGWVVNSSVLHSELGHWLLEHRGDCSFAAAYVVQGNGLVKFSVRSREDFDAAEFCKTFGGGGHAQAAGFELPMSEFQKLYEVNCGQTLQKA